MNILPTSHLLASEVALKTEAEALQNKSTDLSTLSAGQCLLHLALDGGRPLQRLFCLEARTDIGPDVGIDELALQDNLLRAQMVRRFVYVH